MNTVEWFEAVSKVNNLAQLNLVLRCCFNSRGITHYAFTYYNHYATSAYELKYSHVSIPYESWNKHYHCDKCVDIDSTMRKVYQSTLPVYWDLQQQLRDASSERERQMRLDSIEYGAEKGLCIPIHGPENDFATMVVVQMNGQAFMNDQQEIQYFIMNMSQHYYERLKTLLVDDDLRQCDLQLNVQQRRCLALTAKQYSVQAIARQLGIKQRTVNYHLQKANKVLGARNKYESVAKAKSQGLL